jgi:Arc/MetJ family transcription regulator
MSANRLPCARHIARRCRARRPAERRPRSLAGTGILSGETATAHLNSAGVVFKQVGEGRPYPDHARSSREWAEIPPRPVRLDQLITTKNVLDLHTVLAKDSTFYGDLFPHVIRWRGELYLEDGLHRALRAALHQRTVLHVRVLELD